MIRFFATLLLLQAWCATASAETLKLANGDTITGEIVEWDRKSVVFEHPQLGRIRLQLEELAIDTGEPPSPGLFGTGFMRGWDRSIDIGVNGKQGSSQNTKVTGGLNFRYRDDFHRWRINGRYFFDRDEDGVQDHNARLDLARDWLFPGSRWFLRTASRYQFDLEESWKHRISFAPGPGYHLIEGERHTLDLFAGPAFTREFGTRNESLADAVFGFDHESKLSARISMETSNQLFVRMAPEGGDIRNFTRANLSLKLLEEPDLSLKLGVENEVESDPEEDDENYNLNYFMTLSLGF